MKVKNVNPLGAVTVKDLDFRQVEAGETIEVDDDLGARMLEQADNWAPVGQDARATAKEIKAEKAEAEASVESPDAEPGETNG